MTDINQQISYWRAILTEGIPEPSEPLSAALFDLLASGREDRDALWLYVCDHMRLDPRRDFEDWLIACAKHPTCTVEQVMHRMSSLGLKVSKPDGRSSSAVCVSWGKRHARLGKVFTHLGSGWHWGVSSISAPCPRTHERIKWILEAMPREAKWWL